MSRILLLHWGTRGGGPQLHAGLAAALAHRIDVAVSLDAASECADALLAVDAPALVVGARGRGAVARVASQPLDALRLAAFCRRHRIRRIVEIMDHPLQILPRMLVRATGVRVVGAVHDAQRHPGEEHALLTAVAAASLRSLDAVLVLSRGVGESVRRRTRRRVIVTAHPALGVAESTRALPDGEVVLGTLGRLLPYKGIPRLLEAAALLRERGVALSTRIVGRGELPLDDDALHRAGATIERGWVPVEALQREVGAFDVLVLPYDEASQSGVVGLAWHAGVPVACTPVGGLAEQVADGRGAVAASMSATALADAIASLLGDRDAYADASSGGLEAAAASWDRLVDDVLDAVAGLGRA